MDILLLQSVTVYPPVVSSGKPLMPCEVSLNLFCFGSTCTLIVITAVRVCMETGKGVGITDLYKYSSDAVPPIHAVSYHVATDKLPAQNGDKFWSIFSDNLQPIATRGKKPRGTLLVDKHCGNDCSIKRSPLSVSYYNEINGSHIGWVVVRGGGGSAGPVLPLWLVSGTVTGGD